MEFLSQCRYIFFGEFLVYSIRKILNELHDKHSTICSILLERTIIDLLHSIIASSYLRKEVLKNLWDTLKVRRVACSTVVTDNFFCCVEDSKENPMLDWVQIDINYKTEAINQWWVEEVINRHNIVNKCCGFLRFNP